MKKVIQKAKQGGINVNRARDVNIGQPFTGKSSKSDADPERDTAPGVFVSFSSHDLALARDLQAFLQENFPRQRAFLSNDRSCIQAGASWLGEIESHLEQTGVHIVIATEAAMRSHWVHFEIGACWLKAGLTLFLCGGGMTRDTLPEPYRFLQSLDLSRGEVQHTLTHLIERLEDSLGARAKARDTVPFHAERLEARLRAKGGQHHV